MVVGIKILVAVLSVPLMPMFKHIGGESFPGEDITAVPLVSENVTDGPVIPLLHAGFRGAFNIRQQFRDFLGDFPARKASKMNLTILASLSTISNLPYLI